VIRPGVRRQAPANRAGTPARIDAGVRTRVRTPRSRPGGSQGSQARNSAPHLRQAAGRQREAPVLRAVLDFLAMLPGVVSFRQNTGALPVGKRFVRFGVKGMPDVLGSVPWCYSLSVPAFRCPSKHGFHGSRAMALEIKRPGGERSPAQLAMAATLEAAGWLYACVESLEQVQEALGR